MTYCEQVGHERHWTTACRAYVCIHPGCGNHLRVIPIGVVETSGHGEGCAAEEKGA